MSLPRRQTPGDPPPGASWYNTLLEHIQSLTVKGGPGVLVSSSPYGYTISALPGSKVAPSSSGIAAKGGYTGPWMVGQDKDKNWNLLDGSGSIPSAPNLITLGTWSTNVAGQSVTPSAGGYVYLDVTCSNGTYTVTVSSGVIPAATATHLYIPLVYWYQASGATGDPTPIQCQYGSITYPGRLF